MDKGNSGGISRGGTGTGTGTGGANGDRVDRSKVKILLCANDPQSCQEIFSLLCECSYQVTSVLTAVDAVETLNGKGPRIDIILAEVELLVANGARILKCAEFKHVPLIILSRPDQVPVIAKCLRHGAADYLVKPLSENELLNLWMHMRI